MPSYVAKPTPPNQDKRWKLVDATMRRQGQQQRGLIETLHTVQEAFGYLDVQALRYVAMSLRVPLSRAYGVATARRGAARSGHYRGGDHPRQEGLTAHRSLSRILRARARRRLRSGSRRKGRLSGHSRTLEEMDARMTPEELDQIAETEREAQRHITQRVNVCVAAGCLSCQSQSVKDALDQEVQRRGTKDHCQVKGVGCMGLCSEGPLVSTSTGALYKKVEASDGSAILDTLNGGTLNGDSAAGTPVERLVCRTDIPFFQRQKKIVLENSGNIDPDRVEDYIAVNGYTALIKALTEMTSHEVIDQITKSGLRGRGGAGYPTGLKWSTVSKAVGTQKYVICNADEGDPGAFMDRSVLESDPHRVLEGMLIAAYAVGASEGYVYARAEYPLAVKRLRTAIRQAERLGLLGSNICGTRFSFRLDLRLGAGAFVCGEETALIASVEGKRGTPRPRPPYPAMEGLFGEPTLINNVETFANIAPIIRNGGEWYAPIGTEKSKGTKVFGLRVSGARRFDHGLGRHDCHGREFLYGRRSQILHGFLHD